MHDRISCTNACCVMRDSYSTLQYRRPTQTQKTIPSPVLVRLEMMNVYLGPYTNAMNPIATNGQVMTAF